MSLKLRIRSKRHYLTRLPLGIFIILIIAISPFIVGFTGAYFSEMITGEPCHEGNCSWAAVPWFFMITIPVGILLFIIYGITAIVDSYKLFKKDTPTN